jgi:hypothetical protein
MLKASAFATPASPTSSRCFWFWLILESLVSLVVHMSYFMTNADTPGCGNAAKLLQRAVCCNLHRGVAGSDVHSQLWCSFFTFSAYAQRAAGEVAIRAFFWALLPSPMLLRLLEAVCYHLVSSFLSPLIEHHNSLPHLQVEVEVVATWATRAVQLEPSQRKMACEFLLRLVLHSTPILPKIVVSPSATYIHPPCHYVYSCFVCVPNRHAAHSSSSNAGCNFGRGGTTVAGGVAGCFTTGQTGRTAYQPGGQLTGGMGDDGGGGMFLSSFLEFLTPLKTLLYSFLSHFLKCRGCGLLRGWRWIADRKLVACRWRRWCKVSITLQRHLLQFNCNTYFFQFHAYCKLYRAPAIRRQLWWSSSNPCVSCDGHSYRPILRSLLSRS